MTLLALCLAIFEAVLASRESIFSFKARFRAFNFEVWSVGDSLLSSISGEACLALKDKGAYKAP